MMNGEICLLVLSAITAFLGMIGVIAPMNIAIAVSQAFLLLTFLVKIIIACSEKDEGELTLGVFGSLSCLGILAICLL